LNEPVHVAKKCRRNKQISNIQGHSKAPEFTTYGKLPAMQNGENPLSITKSSKFNHTIFVTKPQDLPRVSRKYLKMGNGVYVQK
jgi:hypothetical protein